MAPFQYNQPHSYDTKTSRGSIWMKTSIHKVGFIKYNNSYSMKIMKEMGITKSYTTHMQARMK